MLFNNIFLALPILALASPTPAPLDTSSAPAGLAKRFSESNPWQLTNIAVFEAKSTKNAASTISFDFADTNTGIQLKTHCTRTVAAGASASIIDADNYYNCANNTVSFIFGGDYFKIHRNYIDPAVGPCPQYCNVGAFGNANTTFVTKKVTQGKKGTKLTQAKLEVPITALIA